MRRNSVLGVALLLLLTVPASAGEKEARELLERAIKARGGAEALTRAQQYKRSESGTRVIAGRDQPFTSQVTCSLPDRIRLQIELTKTLKAVVVLDGEKGWQTLGSPTIELPPRRVKEIREEAYVWWLTTLVPLTKSGFTLSTIADTKVEGEEAEGIKVVHKDHPDTRMYFLKRNGLLAKIERQASEAGLSVDKEYLYSAYKDFDGVKLYTKEVMKVNGRKETEVTVRECSFPAKLDEGTFAKP